MRTMLRGKVTLLFMTCALLLAIPAIVLADNIANNLDGSIDADVETTSVNTGDTTTVGYFIQAQGPGVDGDPGCNLDGSAEKLVANVVSSNTGVATVSPSQVTFSGPGCGAAPSVTVTGVSAGTANITLTQASNNSGGTFNFDTAKFSVTVSDPTPADTTAPTIDYTLTPGSPDGSNGWYKSDVTLVWNVTDPESAVTKTGCADQNITSDQAATTYSCSASSAGGNAGPVTVTIKRDATAPTISGAKDPGPNSFGWNNGSVAVNYTCGDNLSGVASCGPDQTLSSEGAGQSSTGSVTDDAGNTASTTVGDINIDLTKPSVALVGGPADGGSYDPDSVPNAPTCTASDALSGLNGACSVSGYDTTVGNHTVTATANDKAGNTNSASKAYSVLGWTLNGFYQPVDMGMTNTAKAGQTVPLKFEMFEKVSGDERTNVSDVKTFTQKVTCGAFEPQEDAIEQYSSGGTSLRYDTTGGQFIFNWQTPKSAGSCFKVIMTPNDTSSNALEAHFKLR